VADVVVVGAGVGGLSAARRLQALGHDVVVFERNDVPGGKLASRTIDGFTWDTGPSLLTLPQWFDVDLGDAVRLDPICRYRWTDGAGFDHRASLVDARAEVERAFGAGAGDRFERFLDHGRRIWEVAERTFFAGPMAGPLSLTRRMRSPLDLLAIDPLTTLHRRATQVLGEPHLVDWADRYATYSGSSAHRAPATLACIAWVEQAFGAWHVPGGLASIAGRLAEGLDVRCSTPVERIEEGAVLLAGGERVRADVVVANVDAEVLYSRLLPDDRALARVRRAQRSDSAYAVLVGLEGRTEGLAHHNVFFGDPFVYVCNPPAEREALFLLATVPAGFDGRLDLVGLLAERGLDLRDRLVVEEHVTPADIERRYASPGGAIYGTSSDGMRAAFLRPRNRGARPWLYLAGGSSHPGGGLPLVMRSGAIVADMIGPA